MTLQRTTDMLLLMSEQPQQAHAHSLSRQKSFSKTSSIAISGSTKRVDHAKPANTTTKEFMNKNLTTNKNHNNTNTNIRKNHKTTTTSIPSRRSSWFGSASHNHNKQQNTVVVDATSTTPKQSGRSRRRRRSSLFWRSWSSSSLLEGPPPLPSVHSGSFGSATSTSLTPTTNSITSSILVQSRQQRDKRTKDNKKRGGNRFPPKKSVRFCLDHDTNSHNHHESMDPTTTPPSTVSASLLF